MILTDIYYIYNTTWESGEGTKEEYETCSLTSRNLKWLGRQFTICEKSQHICKFRTLLQRNISGTIDGIRWAGMPASLDPIFIFPNFSWRHLQPGQYQQTLSSLWHLVWFKVAFGQVTWGGEWSQGRHMCEMWGKSTHGGPVIIS